MCVFLLKSIPTPTSHLRKHPGHQTRPNHQTTGGQFKIQCQTAFIPMRAKLGESCLKGTNAWCHWVFLLTEEKKQRANLSTGAREGMCFGAIPIDCQHTKASQNTYQIPPTHIPCRTKSHTMLHQSTYRMPI